MQLKKALLILAFGTILIIGMLYGISPSWFLTTFSTASEPASIDQTHILRAVMMLYIALGLFWLYAAFSDRYRDIGIVILAIFCGGLVAGRILSVVIDGPPSPLFVLYIFMELALIPICIWLLKKDGQLPPPDKNRN
ncbi:MULTISPECIES: DUF4345 domain-containing protein [Desulfosediminicola]|uniref:DUF4345 domain-containing protein n=1 Tax=Desulfosediminicola TaxID=2886823 RepID=UPI0010ABD40B|nr:DUF4345 domain-containing protein [Desulfosediminicola ganghwensis]